jgi:hypothetical protein
MLTASEVLLPQIWTKCALRQLKLAAAATHVLESWCRTRLVSFLHDVPGQCCTIPQRVLFDGLLQPSTADSAHGQTLPSIEV